MYPKVKQIFASRSKKQTIDLKTFSQFYKNLFCSFSNKLERLLHPSIYSLDYA